jgi:hypothetical protein
VENPCVLARRRSASIASKAYITTSRIWEAAGRHVFPGEWSTVMLKPYPMREEDKPRFQMVERWEALERAQK